MLKNYHTSPNLRNPTHARLTLATDFDLWKNPAADAVL